jgi:hypothetical protein
VHDQKAGVQLHRDVGAALRALASYTAPDDGTAEPPVADRANQRMSVAAETLDEHGVDSQQAARHGDFSH